MARCQNAKNEPGNRFLADCTREAQTEYKGRPMCNICAAARKRGDARYKANRKREQQQFASRDAREAEERRKIIAFPAMLAALEAVAPFVDSFTADHIDGCDPGNPDAEAAGMRCVCAKGSAERLLPQIYTAIGKAKGE